MHATAASASTQKSQTQPIKSGSLSFKDKQKMFESAQS
jgi:hypothetical protein